MVFIVSIVIFTIQHRCMLDKNEYPRTGRDSIWTEPDLHSSPIYIPPSSALASRFPCCISFIFVALIFVLKYSRRWRPPIGGCKKFEPPFRPEMSNLIHFEENLATYILSNKNLFPPPLFNSRASYLGPVVTASHLADHQQLYSLKTN